MAKVECLPSSRISPLYRQMPFMSSTVDDNGDEQRVNIRNGRRIETTLFQETMFVIRTAMERASAKATQFRMVA